MIEIALVVLGFALATVSSEVSARRSGKDALRAEQRIRRRAAYGAAIVLALDIERWAVVAVDAMDDGRVADVPRSPPQHRFTEALAVVELDGSDAVRKSYEELRLSFTALSQAIDVCAISSTSDVTPMHSSHA